MRLPTIKKRDIINIMPVVALGIIILGAVAPVSVDIKFLAGFIFGSIGSIVIPYWREWKVNNETLKFNLKYFTPIITSIIILVTSIAYVDVLITINTLFSGFPTFLVYIGAVILGYGNKAILLAFIENARFLEELRDIITDISKIATVQETTTSETVV
ncbi:MAG: hypothetical protein GF411_02765 [Candidatus Lokiarchaeota archaeon]|nr:hypothetical protein [Candidatus Lokiarchaeota archaeon]